MDYGDQFMSIVAVSYVFITRSKKPNRHISVGHDDVYIRELNYIQTFSTITEDYRKISRISQVYVREQASNTRNPVRTMH